MKMKKHLFVSILLVSFALSGCFENSVGTSEKTTEVSEKTEVSTIYDLGSCTRARKGVEIFVKSENKTYVCVNKEWLTLDSNEDCDDEDCDEEIESDDEIDGVSSSSRSSRSSSSKRSSFDDGESVDSNRDENSAADEGADEENGNSSSDEDSVSESKNDAEEKVEDVKLSSSSEAAEQSSADNVIEYNCDEYDCFTTEYLNQEMLAAGKYGYLLDDRDNQVYRTVKIGTQVWMAQNLNYQTPGGTIYCYDDISSYCEKYGRLYVRAAVSCPTGWHLPSDTEWETLFAYVGGADVAGDALRASSGWDKHPELESKDEYGFSSLPAGVYYFGDEGNTGWYLSDTFYNDFAIGAGPDRGKSTAADYTAISVRCIQD